MNAFLRFVENSFRVQKWTFKMRKGRTGADLYILFYTIQRPSAEVLRRHSSGRFGHGPYATALKFGSIATGKTNSVMLMLPK